MKKKPFNNYLFRCSSISNLMIKPKKKGEVLSASTKAFLKDIFISVKYGRIKEINNKYMDKGVFVEEDNLTLMQRYYKRLCLKNQKNYQNEYIQGTPDLVLPRRVVDAKSSWDIFTFGHTDKVISDYYWQLMGYMGLTGKKQGDLFFGLINTPEHLIVNEKQKRAYQKGVMDNEVELKALEEAVEHDLTYDDIPAKDRYKVFHVKYNAEEYNQILLKVEMAREYLNNMSL